MIGDARMLVVQAESQVRERREERAMRDPEWALIAQARSADAGLDLSSRRRALVALVLSVLGRS